MRLRPLCSLCAAVTLCAACSGGPVAPSAESTTEPETAEAPAAAPEAPPPRQAVQLFDMTLQVPTGTEIEAQPMRGTASLRLPEREVWDVSLETVDRCSPDQLARLRADPSRGSRVSSTAMTCSWRAAGAWSTASRRRPGRSSITSSAASEEPRSGSCAARRSKI